MITASEALAVEPPKSWRTIPFWSLFRREKRTGFPEEELLSVYRDHGVVPKTSRDDNNNKASEDLSAYQLVTKGALVTNKMKAWQGSIAISRHQGIVSPAYYVYTPLSEEHDQFLHYLLRSGPYIALYQRISKGIRVSQWDLEHEALRTIPVLLPDLPTQKRIAAFLDRETARIDTLIAKKGRLVEVLEERRVAVREHLLWGSGPLTKLGHHITILPGYAFASSGFSAIDTDIRLLRGANIGVDEVKWEDTVYWPASETEGLERFFLSDGDLVMGMDRPWISNGIRVAQISQTDLPCLLLQRVCKISPRKTIDVRFLKAAIESNRFLGYFEPLLTGVSVPHISSDQIANFRFPFLERGQQTKRMDAYDDATKSIRPIIAATNTSITRLREYRAALITAAVTGQMDVESYTRTGTSSATLDRIEEEMQE